MVKTFASNAADQSFSIGIEWHKRKKALSNERKIENQTIDEVNANRKAKGVRRGIKLKPALRDEKRPQTFARLARFH
jgi:hypothetical protein